MVSNIGELFFWCSLFTFSDTRMHEFQEFVEQNMCCQTSVSNGEQLVPSLVLTISTFLQSMRGLVQ